MRTPAVDYSILLILFGATMLPIHLQNVSIEDVPKITNHIALILRSNFSYRDFGPSPGPTLSMTVTRWYLKVSPGAGVLLTIIKGALGVRG